MKEVGMWARDFHGETLVVEKSSYDVLTSQLSALKLELEKVKGEASRYSNAVEKLYSLVERIPIHVPHLQNQAIKIYNEAEIIVARETHYREALQDAPKGGENGF